MIVSVATSVMANDVQLHEDLARLEEPIPTDEAALAKENTKLDEVRRPCRNTSGTGSQFLWRPPSEQ